MAIYKAPGWSGKGSFGDRRDNCELCGSDPKSCRNRYCSANAQPLSQPFWIKPRQGPGPGFWRRAKKVAAQEAAQYERSSKGKSPWSYK